MWSYSPILDRVQRRALWSLLAVAVPCWAGMFNKTQDGLQSFLCPHLSRHFEVWDAHSSGDFRSRFGQKVRQELPAGCEVQEQEAMTEPDSFLQVGTHLHHHTFRRQAHLMRKENGFAGAHGYRPALVPYPKSVSLPETSATAVFQLCKDTTIRLGPGVSEDMPHVAASLASLRERLGHATRELPEGSGSSGHVISLGMAEKEGADPDSYKLTVQNGQILLEAHGPEGFSHGVTTVKQLIPLSVSPDVGSLLENSVGVNSGALPQMVIEDAPAFKWRGVHLDVSRHFFPPEDVKKLLDTMAAYKLNRFHWHLTDDQGWRFPVQGYPKLTEIGAGPRFTGLLQMSSGEGIEGSYTEEQIKDVLAYAKARHIKVIPEVDVPGHVAAAVAAYPELGNPDYPPPAGPQHEFGVHKWTLAPTKKVSAFLETVFSEVARLFPDSEYIHFGGDEAPKDQWHHASKKAKKDWEPFKGETQSYFNKKVSDIIRSKGKKMAGWDEVQAFSSLPKDAVVFAWRSENELKKALHSGRSAVNAVSTKYYLDHYQGSEHTEPKAIGGPLTTARHVYEYDPLPRWVPEHQKHLMLGAQVQLWSEYFPTWHQVEYMAWPRTIALAERLWSPQEAADFPDFKQRLGKRLLDLKHWGVNYHSL